MWCNAIQSAKSVSKLLLSRSPWRQSLAVPGLTINIRINTNAYRQCFWCVAYLLHDNALLDQIKREMQPAWQDNAVDMTHLLEKCPLLASFYEEMLRVNNEYGSSFSRLNLMIS